MLVGLLLAGALAPANPEPAVAFEWDAPRQCPSQEEVDAKVELGVGAPLSSDRSRRLDVIARVRRAEAEGAQPTWALRIWFITDEETRRRDLENPDCDLLADAAATLVALNVELLSPRLESVPEDPPRETIEASADPLRSPDSPMLPALPPQPPPQPTHWFEGRVGGGIVVGPLPGVGGGPALSLLWTFRGARLELGGSVGWAAPRSVDMGQARYILIDGSLRAGYAWTFERWEVALTGGVLVGAVRGETTNLPREGAAARLFFGLVAGPSVAFRPRPWLSLWIGVDGFAVPMRPVFEVDGEGTIHRSGPVGVRALGGLGLRIPSSRNRGRAGHSPNER